MGQDDATSPGQLPESRRRQATAALGAFAFVASLLVTLACRSCLFGLIKAQQERTAVVSTAAACAHKSPFLDQCTFLGRNLRGCVLPAGAVFVVSDSLRLSVRMDFQSWGGFCERTDDLPDAHIIDVYRVRTEHAQRDRLTVVMYRNKSGNLKFSWNALMVNAFPPLANGSTKDPGHISLDQQDNIYGAQIRLPRPRQFLPSTLEDSLILDSTSEAHATYQQLQKCGVVEADGSVHTDKIDKHFTHHLSKVSVARQKQIVDLLFWWEDESMRLSRLQEERKELETIVAAEDGKTDGIYAALLERVQCKIDAKPSARDVVMEKDEDELIVKFKASEAALPPYQK